MWTTKKKLKKEICQLENKIKELEYKLNEIVSYNEELADVVEDFKNRFPFELDDVVYDIQLRNAKGRYTKVKGCKEHSTVNEVVVNKKNYFTLVERFNANEVFRSRTLALNRLDELCVE